LFDSDNAGQAATLRALNIAYQHDIFPKKISLPE
jgi:DNA primase